MKQAMINTLIPKSMIILKSSIPLVSVQSDGL